MPAVNTFLSAVASAIVSTFTSSISASNASMRSVSPPKEFINASRNSCLVMLPVTVMPEILFESVAFADDTLDTLTFSPNINSCTSI